GAGGGAIAPALALPAFDSLLAVAVPDEASVVVAAGAGGGLTAAAGGCGSGGWGGAGWGPGRGGRGRAFRGGASAGRRGRRLGEGLTRLRREGRRWGRSRGYGAGRCRWGARRGLEASARRCVRQRAGGRRHGQAADGILGRRIEELAAARIAVS